MGNLFRSLVPDRAITIALLVSIVWATSARSRPVATPPAPSVGADTAPGTWISLDQGPDRYYGAAAWDSRRNRLLVLDGSAAAGPVDGLVALVLDGSQAWTAIATTGTTPPHIGAYFGNGGWAFYDPGKDELIFGQCNDYHLHVWALSLSGTPTWRRVVPDTLTTSYALGAPTYDPRRERLIFYGGTYYGLHGYLGVDASLRVLDLASGQISTLTSGVGPSARAGSRLAYDPVHDRLVLHGGGTYGSTALVDTWTYTFASGSWREVSPPIVPYGGVALTTLRYDARRQQMVGWSAGGNALEELVEGSPWSWQTIPTTATPASDAQTIPVADSLGDRLLAARIDGVYALALSTGTWSMARPADWTPPAFVADPSPVYDTNRMRLLVPVGAGSYPDYSQPLWTLDTGASPAWSQLPASLVKYYKYDPLVFDAGGDRIVEMVNSRQLKYTPITGVASYGAIAAGWTLWESNLVRLCVDEEQRRLVGPIDNLRAVALDMAPGVPWRAGRMLTKLGVSAVSPPVADVARRRELMLVTEHFSTGTTYIDSLQLWSVSFDDSLDWTYLGDATRTIGGLQGVTLALDPVRDRLLAFGGVPLPYGSLPRNRLWSLPLHGGPANWTEIAASAFRPGARANAGIVYDIGNDQLVVISGDSLGHVLRDTWLLPFGSPPRFSVAPLAPPAESAGDSLRIVLVASNPLGATQPFTCSLRGNRAWPGWPAAALVRLAPGASDTVRFALAVPDTATAGMLAWTATAAWLGGAAIADSCAGTVQVAGPVVLVAAVAPRAIDDPGHVVELSWILRNPTLVARDYDCVVSASRPWPGLPQGFATLGVAAGASDTVTVRLAVPDTAASGEVLVSLRAGRSGWAAGDSSAVTLVIVADLALPPAVVAFSDVVTLTWQTTLASGALADVQVARDRGPWITIATVAVDATGRCTYADHAAVPGTDCSYRLAATVNGVASTSAPVTVSVPAATRFALQGFRPNPSRGAPAVAFGLAHRGAARLEVFDLAGRRVWVQAFDELPPGPHVVPLDPVAVLSPGLFIIRLTQGGQTLSARGIVVR